MAAVDDVDQLIEQYHQALDEFVKENPEPVKKLFSHQDNVTLANPLGPPAHGWEQVAPTIERAASNLNYCRRAPAWTPGLLCIPHIRLIYREFESEPPRTRTWNLEIKSLSR
jgi:hypothetical protein